MENKGKGIPPFSPLHSVMACGQLGSESRGSVLSSVGGWDQAVEVGGGHTGLAAGAETLGAGETLLLRKLCCLEQEGDLLLGPVTPLRVASSLNFKFLHLENGNNAVPPQEQVFVCMAVEEFQWLCKHRCDLPATVVTVGHLILGHSLVLSRCGCVTW